jgi:hypothetical protein
MRDQFDFENRPFLTSLASCVRYSYDTTLSYPDSINQNWSYCMHAQNLVFMHT